MAIIGPRPALWNQYDLVAERDKYGVNDIKPGLTGWAQINGRDELEIPVKAALDGEYVDKMGLFFDIRCFFGTIAAVFKHDGVVEGGTGALKKDGGYADAEPDAEAVDAEIGGASETESDVGAETDDSDTLSDGEPPETGEVLPKDESIGIASADGLPGKR